MNDLANALDRQNAEFDALTDLATQWEKLRRVPVVDDDYLEQRSHYEAAMQRFIRAIRANKRIS